MIEKTMPDNKKTNIVYKSGTILTCQIGTFDVNKNLIKNCYIVYILATIKRKNKYKNLMYKVAMWQLTEPSSGFRIYKKSSIEYIHSKDWLFGHLSIISNG